MASVILFIVEGPSDQDALIIPLHEQIIKKRLKATVKVMHGDILTGFIKNTSTYEVTTGNVKKKITEIVNGFLKSSTLLKSKDLLKIFYITDTDRCFIDSESHHINKRNCLKTLFNTEFVTLGTGSALKNIPFNIIFMNENLEQLLELRKDSFSDEEKTNISDLFSRECESDFRKYITTFKNSSIEYWLSYRESYEGIKECDRIASNMNNFLEEFNLLD